MNNYCKCGHHYLDHLFSGKICKHLGCNCMEFREKEQKKMKITLPNGLVVEGTEQRRGAGRCQVTTISTIVADAERLSACREAVQWLRAQPDPETAWASCERPDWMIWYATRKGVDHKALVRVACAAVDAAYAAYAAYAYDEAHWQANKRMCDIVRAHISLQDVIGKEEDFIS